MNEFERNQLKDFFDTIVNEVNTPSFIEKDPIQFPRRYDLKSDKEIVGLLTALISWGKRSMILKNAEKMLSFLGPSPHKYILENDFDNIPLETIHRTFNGHDLKYICKGLHSIYSNHSSMEELFLGRDLFDGIENLRNIIIAANENPRDRCEKHLSCPSKNSACKRIHMFLKWMVRNDGIVDLGCWNQIDPSNLYIPLDTHVMQVAFYFKLLKRKQSDRKSVEELTKILQSFCKEDPIKYDYALFGLGVNGILKDENRRPLF